MVATVRSQVTMYKALAQSVLLYGRESWVVTGDMLKVLTTCHHQLAQRIAVMTEKCGAGREWEYPAAEEAMDFEGILPIRVYIKRR